MFKFGKSSRNNMEGIRKEIKILANRVLSKSVHDFGIPRYGGIRTAETQKKLYDTKVNGKRITKCDGVKKLSYHQSGNALDIFAYHSEIPKGRKRACWKCTYIYEEISELFKNEFNLMKEEGLFLENEVLEWGGDWKWKDLPHFQIVKKEE
jgi:peptidoglycan L-alanyl-D-glutamate endopeptidase CwlK